jgi:hypothetical protein
VGLAKLLSFPKENSVRALTMSQPSIRVTGKRVSFQPEVACSFGRTAYNYIAGCSSSNSPIDDPFMRETYRAPELTELITKEDVIEILLCISHIQSREIEDQKQLVQAGAPSATQGDDDYIDGEQYEALNDEQSSNGSNSS